MEELCEEIPHKRVAVATVEEIRAQGYDVVVTSGRAFHVTLVVPEDLDDTSAEDLAGLFKVRMNPQWRSSV